MRGRRGSHCLLLRGIHDQTDKSRSRIGLRKQQIAGHDVGALGEETFDDAPTDSLGGRSYKAGFPLKAAHQSAIRLGRPAGLNTMGADRSSGLLPAACSALAAMPPVRARRRINVRPLVCFILITVAISRRTG